MTNIKDTNILERGELINDTYKVEFFIGQGSFGEVYRVRHKYFDDFQVMKVLKKVNINEESVNEIANEGKILSKLTHPNIVRVFEVNTFIKNNNQYVFITMGFVGGESLSQLLKRKIHLPVSNAVLIMIDILKALNNAHSNDPTIIHRDINPDNIFLSYEKEQSVGLLGDFGISMLLNSSSNLANAGGRYMYFAPECFMNCYLPCSDVFSSGIVLYKMLTGTLPWEYDFDSYCLDEDEDFIKMIKSGRKRPCLKPTNFNNNIDLKLESIIMKSLENDMEVRYRTAGEFLNALEIVRDEESLSGKNWR